MFSALSWTLWKMRNELCFETHLENPFRSIIVLIVSLVTYGTGTTKRKTRELITDWLPEETEAVPLQVWDPSPKGHSLQRPPLKKKDPLTKGEFT